MAEKKTAISKKYKSIEEADKHITYDAPLFKEKKKPASKKTSKKK